MTLRSYSCLGDTQAREAEAWFSATSQTTRPATSRALGLEGCHSSVGAAAVYTKIWEKSAGTRMLPRLRQSRSRLRKD